MPDGLRELMADIAREVLRYQPANIENFIADYLEAMLMTRELAFIANQTVEDVLDSTCQIVELLQEDGVSVEQAEMAVKIIKEEFKSHSEEIGEDEPLRELDIVNRLVTECDLSVEQAKKASEIIESAWCFYYQRNKGQSTTIDPGAVDFEAVKNTLAIYQESKGSDLNKSGKILQAENKGYSSRKFQSGGKVDQSQSASSLNWQTPNFQQREQSAVKIQSWYRALKERQRYKRSVKAATAIQAGFRGYKVRKDQKLLQAESKVSVLSVSSDGETRQQAAIVIQSGYRAYKVRKELKKMNRAAVIIQAHYKGFIDRKKLRQEKK